MNRIAIIMIGCHIILVSLLLGQTVNSEPTNGRVWELMDRFDEPQLEVVQLDHKFDQLPDQFEISRLPETIQPPAPDSEQIRFDLLGTIDMLTNRQPDDPYSIDTKFHIYQAKSSKTIEFRLFDNCLEQLKAQNCVRAPFNLNEMLNIFELVNKRTLIIIGGFLTDAPADWQLQIADRWLRLEDLNVIIVSWNKGNRFIYNRAVANTKVVARQIVILLYYIAKLNKIDPRDEKFADNIMIVGHSLGAHIAGFVGQDFGGRIGRITGLDPAGPSFSESHESHRLDRNDAQFVDVIHTNADFGYNFFLGLYNQVGHVDYYANDGKWQPACKLNLRFLECNHSAVIHYYISILEHELDLLHSGKPRDLYRVVTYRANSFNQFRTGKSMHLNCPLLARDTQLESDSIGQDTDFGQCGIPIDFIKPHREYRFELEKYHQINFSPIYKPKDKYWFFTSPKRPFVVEHNLLKLHYDVPMAKYGYDIDVKQCSLRMTYKMLKDDELTVIELAKFKPRFDGIDHPHTSIPFVNHILNGRFSLMNLDSISSDDDESLIRLAYDIFPVMIKLETEPIEQKSTINRIHRWLVGNESNSTNDDPSKKKCEYKFKTIRVQPLRKTNRFFMAIYSSKAMDPSAILEPKILRIDASVRTPEISLSIPIINPTVHLDTILVGSVRDNVASSTIVEPDTIFTSSYEEAVKTGKIKPVDYEFSDYDNSIDGYDEMNYFDFSQVI